MKNSSLNLDKLITQSIRHYLNHRPAFFSLIRPQEIAYFHRYQTYLKSPALDFGCGDGFFAQLAFTNLKGKLIGVDLPSSRIDQEKSASFYLDLVVYAGLQLPFPSNHFNSAVSNCVFEHLPDLDKNLSELHRVLKPGGFLLTSVMTDRWEEHLIGGKIFGQPYLKYLRKRQEHLNLLSLEKWQEKFIQTGFEITESVGYLNPYTSKILEITHYLSVSSLVSQKLLGSWVPVPNWFKPLKLDKVINRAVSQDLDIKPSQAAALFFVLKKA
jgi:ubiquinone/menaquinone biosynthesis C-methylase UbiE